MDRRTFLARTGATAGLAGLGGCAALAGPSLSSSDYDVGMRHVVFDPARIEVAVGDTVVWGNVGSRSHTVTANGPSVDDGATIPGDATYFASGGFDSQAAANDGWPERGAIDSGETYEHTFETPGEFPYYCIPHEPQGMRGTVVVTE